MTTYPLAQPEDSGAIAARAQRLLDEFLKGRTAATEATYRDSLRQLARFAGVTVDELVRHLGASMGAANELVMRWRADMLDRGAAPATINARLSAARSLVKRMRAAGLIPWTLEVAGVRSRPYRDTTGPSLELVRKFLATAGRSPRPATAARDTAILRCLFDQALRRYEVVGLRLEDVRLDTGDLWILPKGYRERVSVAMSAAASAAMTAWLRERGDAPGRVFLALSRRHAGKPLTTKGLNKLIGRLASKIEGAGRVTPHGFRHAAITAALASGRSPREVQIGLARHAKLETTLIYDDNRKKLSRDLAETVSRALG